MVTYREIAKPMDEVLEKHFVHMRPWSVELKHRLDNPMLKLSGHMASDGRLNCASSSKLALGPLGVTGMFGLDGSAGLQLSYNSDLAEGLKLQADLSSVIKTVREQKVELQAKYTKDPWRVHMQMNPVDRRWSAAMLARHAITQHTGHFLSWGLDVSGDKLAAPALSGIGLGYSYPILGHTVSTAAILAPAGAKQIGKVTLAFASRTPNESEIAARFTYIVPEDRGELSVGAGWYLDPTKRTTSIKMRLNADKNIAMSLTHKVSDNASLTIGVGFSGERSKTDVDNIAKVGVRLNLTA